MIDYPERLHQLNMRCSPCVLCPHRCGVDRSGSARGRCHAGIEASVSSFNLHFGEEPPISGIRGSGTIFFTGCTLACVFCQNYPISQLRHGTAVPTEKLSSIMLNLQDRGAHNINLVTPSHSVAAIIAAVSNARAQGLTIPLVYNCSGFEEVETLKLLDGIIDIYLPDSKYGSDDNALKYSGVKGYVGINRKALKEMHRQVGDLAVDADGIATRGMIVRHLVLPEDLSGTREVLGFISRELSPAVFISLMAQYHPAHRSGEFPELTRRLTQQEYDQALEWLEEFGLSNGWQQEL